MRNWKYIKTGNSKVANAVFSYEDKARIAKQRYLEAKANKDYPEGVKYEERMAKDNINHLNEILQKIRTGKMDPRYEADEKDVEKAISIYKQIGNSKVANSATFDRLENAISVIYTYYYTANKQLEYSSFSATNCINALSHIKQACDEAIKLAQKYDREINK